MRINVSEAYREEFEVFISGYQKFCDRLIDLVVKTVSIETLNTYCRDMHPDVMPRLTGTVSSSYIMRGIIEKCSVTNITPLMEVIQHYRITGGERLIEAYQRLLDEYLSKLRVRYLLGSYKDITSADEIIFILVWTPDEASFPHIKQLLYEAFGLLKKNIIVQATTAGKKNSASIIIIMIHTHLHNHVSISLLLYVVQLIQSYF